MDLDLWDLSEHPLNYVEKKKEKEEEKKTEKHIHDLVGQVQHLTCSFLEFNFSMIIINREIVVFLLLLSTF